MTPSRGGREAVEALLPLVRSFFARRCPSREEAEDLSQEALCEILAALPRFRGASSPATWAWAVCRHVLAREARRCLLRERAGRLAEAGARPSAEPCPEEAWTLAGALGELGPGERLLYRRFYEEGRSVAETASLLGRPEGTIKYQLFLLRRRLRELLLRGR